MNAKKESKRNKTRQQQNYLTPVPKRQAHDNDLNLLNLRDLSPFRPLYGTHHTSSHLYFSNRDMTIIETPAKSPGPHLLQQIDQGPFPISGVINWKSQLQDQQENEQEQSQIVSISQSEPSKQQMKQNKQTQPKEKEKAINNNLRTPQQKQKKDIHKKMSQSLSTVGTAISSSKKVTCNCKKTKCLKLYCDCFRINQTCDGCNCVGCHNLSSYDEERNNAMLSLMDRNPQAFKPKIDEQQHAKGCHCKKSNCSKKYCQCFQAGLRCGSNCKCQDCKNCQPGDRNDLNSGINSLTINIQNLLGQDKEKQKNLIAFKDSTIKMEKKIEA